MGSSLGLLPVITSYDEASDLGGPVVRLRQSTACVRPMFDQIRPEPNGAAARRDVGSHILHDRANSSLSYSVELMDVGWAARAVDQLGVHELCKLL